MERSARTFFAFLWLTLVILSLYFYLFHADFFQNQILHYVKGSTYTAYALILFLGIIRGLTLVPVTFLIVLGLLLIPPLPLFFIILAGILISSLGVYYFFDFLHLDKLFEKKYPRQIEKIRSALTRNELPIVIAWSAFPFLPTDVICYVCGTLEVDVRKFMLGLLIGEGIACSLYIFFGHYLVNHFHLSL